MSNTIGNHDPAGLGGLEREILSIVWKQAPITAEAVRESLGRRLKESTVRTVLHRLESKGYLRHSVDNRTYVYRAVREPRQVAALAVKRIVDWLCDGSMEELFVGMVDIEIVDQTQLKQLSNRIARARKRGK